ncbi:MAG: hypothetical protein ACE14L_07765 [Terriglobales bacterium]
MANVAFKGVGGLIIALAVVATLLIAIPAYRIFFLISLGIAAVVVVILHFWNKRPVKTPEDDQVRLNLDK